MAVNFALMRALAPEPSYVNIPYTLFKEQVEAGNVSEVTSQGDAIQGTFKKEVTYPREGPDARSALRFKTLLPAFANPGLETLLEAQGVVINARPLDEGRRPLLQPERLGVHRDDRRGGRGARARSLQAGPRGRAVDHLHRRAGRHRPGAGERGGDRGSRRARANAQPDPDRDGRFRLARG